MLGILKWDLTIVLKNRISVDSKPRITTKKFLGDDEPSLHLMSTMRPEFQHIPVPEQVPHLQRAPFMYPHKVPISKPMMHFDSIESMPNEIFQNPQMHMLMPVTVDTTTGPMVFLMQVPSDSFSMPGQR